MNTGIKVIIFLGITALATIIAAVLVGRPDINPADFKVKGESKYYDNFTAENFCGISTKAKCSFDYECKTGGCSGQICEGKDENTITTCEWKECYDAIIYGVTCGCFDGRCQWAKKR
ncbi:MAG: eight-cysteine-cluster domain-containing protein [Candidatus Woesearchaeota archaeon]|nr:eight-cysteine-cluster domain-containing protein [Candidatus Woesearchaeota archaeon]